MSNRLKIVCFIVIAASSVIYAKPTYHKNAALKGEGGAQIIINNKGDTATYKSATGKTFKLAPNSEILWADSSISNKLRYILFDTSVGANLGPDPYHSVKEWRNYCPIIDFRTGCIVYMALRYECAGKWKSNSIWVADAYGGTDTHEIDAAKQKGPQVKSVWLDFIDGFNSNEEGKYKKKYIDKDIYIMSDNYNFAGYLDDYLPPDNVQNALVCDHINSDNLAYYKLIKQQLKNEKNKDYKLIQKAIKEAAITSDKVSKQIVSKKAPLYNTPRNKDKSSAYLVAGDSIVIVDESKIKRGWYEISYISKTGKILNKWIHAADIAGNSNIKTLADEPEPKKKEENFGGDKTLFSSRYTLIDKFNHAPLPFTKYKIKRADGRIEKGVTDKHGYTRPIKMGKEGKKEYIYLKLDI